MLGKIKSTLFGGTKPVSTLTPAQRELLSQLGGLQQDYNPSTYAGLAGIAGSPDSAYKYDAEGMQNAFKQGVFNPAMQQLNQQLGATKHSSSLHSSANRYAQDQLRQNIMNNLNNINWQNLLRQQEMEQQGQENAYARQMQALGGLMGGNQAVLGTQGTALQKTGGRNEYKRG